MRDFVLGVVFTASFVLLVLISRPHSWRGCPVATATPTMTFNALTEDVHPVDIMISDDVPFPEVREGLRVFETCSPQWHEPTFPCGWIMNAGRTTALLTGQHDPRDNGIWVHQAPWYELSDRALWWRP